MVAAQCNPIEYDRLTMLFAQVMALVQLAKLAIECGKPDDVNGYLERMKLIGNFTDDCSCSSEAGLVTGLGGAGNTTIVESGDATVVVTPVVVGSTTTYTVTLSTTFVNFVNTLYAAVVAPGDNITVVDSGVIAGVRTFTVNGLKSIVDQGYGISVDISPTVAGVTTYTVSVALTAVSAESVVAFPIPLAVGTLVTACTATASETGTHIIMAEADMVGNGANVTLAYRLVKNDVTPINADRQVVSAALGGVSITNKLVVPAIPIFLTAGDTVKFQIDSNAVAGNIVGRSITLLRIV
jgi:hypothetical protein